MKHLQIVNEKIGLSMAIDHKHKYKDNKAQPSRLSILKINDSANSLILYSFILQRVWIVLLLLDVLSSVVPVQCRNVCSLYNVVFREKSHSYQQGNTCYAKKVVY